MEKAVDMQDYTELTIGDATPSLNRNNKSSIIEFSDSRIQRKMRERAASNQVAAINPEFGQVYIWRPYHLEELKEIEYFINNKDTVIFYSDSMEGDEKQRMIDYFCGLCYARKHPVYEAASGTYIVSFSDDDESLLTVNEEVVAIHQ